MGAPARGALLGTPGAPLDAESYKWIWVGGKGGVGKTTTSCAIAVRLARDGRRVLLISTDPASSIGDSFGQHFSGDPQPVVGCPNLWAMETPKMPDDVEPALAFPGVDEFQNLTSLFDTIERDDYEVVVFDTAPTGHTVRLLQLPGNADRLFGGFGMLAGQVMQLVRQVFGEVGDATDRIQRFQGLLRQAAERLRNPLECTFVCVLLPEFLPVFETERLIGFLDEQKIETHVMVVNQVIDESRIGGCEFCKRKVEMQRRHLQDIQDTYGDCFGLLHVPLFSGEVRGREAIMAFAEHLAPLFGRSAAPS